MFIYCDEGGFCIHLSIYLFQKQSIYQYIYLSLYLYIYISIYLENGSLTKLVRLATLELALSTPLCLPVVLESRDLSMSCLLTMSSDLSWMDLSWWPVMDLSWWPVMDLSWWPPLASRDLSWWPRRRSLTLSYENRNFSLNWIVQTFYFKP